MQCDDLEIQRCPTRHLNELDSALHELGMLATRTRAQDEYYREMHGKRALYRMLKINSRYVSNVSIGFQLRPTAPHLRYKPYAFGSRREERHRTRSENNDSSDAVDTIVRSILEDNVRQTTAAESGDLAQLKKAKSLESIIAENDPAFDINAISIPENEVVSDLERLRVDE